MVSMGTCAATFVDGTPTDVAVRNRLIAALCASLESHAAAVGRVDLVDRVQGLPTGVWPPPELLGDVVEACGDGDSVLDGMERHLEELAAADFAAVRSGRRRARAFLDGVASIPAALADVFNGGPRPRGH